MKFKIYVEREMSANTSKAIFKETSVRAAYILGVIATFIMKHFSTLSAYYVTIPISIKTDN